MQCVFLCQKYIFEHVIIMHNFSQDKSPIPSENESQEMSKIKATNSGKYGNIQI